MVYYHGDIHGNPTELIRKIQIAQMTADDIVVILGDAGFNYYGGRRDAIAKDMISAEAPTVLCIHGNHEARPHTIETYKTKEWNGGTVWYEEAYPNLLFAKDGEIYSLGEWKHLVIGGAYSVDKCFRLASGWNWWIDEQPTEETKRLVEAKIEVIQPDAILTHTCPFKYEPVEMFLAGIDQSTVDSSTERWLDEIEEKADYKAWLCGHWHIDKRVDSVYFLFNNLMSQERLIHMTKKQKRKEMKRNG